MYFGLQVGSVNTMSTSTALISFAVFKGSRRWLTQAFTPTENVVVQTIASSISGMPIAASMLSVIPALEFLGRPDEGGERRFSIPNLVLWSLGVSLFGTVFAAPFRAYFLLRERLRFPGGYATGVLIGVLHHDKDVARNAFLDKMGSSYQGSQGAPTSSFEDADGDASASRTESPEVSVWASKVATIFFCF